MRRGLLITDFDGQERVVVPLLFSYVADHVEATHVTCTKHGHQTARPCSVCLCPRERLNDMSYVPEWRSEGAMTRAVRFPHAHGETMESLKNLSLHYIEVRCWSDAFIV